MLFVPKSRRRTPIPCRHIPLNNEGSTLDSMYRLDSSQEIEATLRQWLIKTIAKVETLEDADKTPANVQDEPNSKA